jgi:hypothetical protein
MKTSIHKLLTMYVGSLCPFFLTQIFRIIHSNYNKEKLSLYNRMAFPAEYFVALVILLVVVVLAYNRRKPQVPKEDFINFPGMKPTLWWFVDDENNARSWLDFGGRNTTEPNRGYLQVALESLRKTQGDDFNIKPLIGRDAVLSVIQNAPSAAKRLPPALWRRWAISNLLNCHGGLAMDGDSTLTVGPSFKPYLTGVEAAAFGVTSDEPIVSPSTAFAPGPAPYVGWSAAPRHPAWAYAADIWGRLVNRGPQAWSSAEARRTYMYVFEAQRAKGLKVIREAEASRTPDGRPRDLEDLFGRVSEPADPKTALTPRAVYVPYDGDELARRFEFNWFLRMSPAQIKESELVWARLAGF